jgi:hypothetical protein
MELQIKQDELRQIVYLKREVEPMLERLAELTENVKAMLIHGLEVELGRYDASLIWRYTRHPAWRKVVEERLGHDVAEEIFISTPGHTICDVRVEEHAVLPLWNNEDEDDENE